MTIGLLQLQIFPRCPRRLIENWGIKKYVIIYLDDVWKRSVSLVLLVGFLDFNWILRGSYSLFIFH
jgi:hypothetical protein